MSLGPPHLGPHPGRSKLRTIGEKLLWTFEQPSKEQDQLRIADAEKIELDVRGERRLKLDRYGKISLPHDYF